MRAASAACDAFEARVVYLLVWSSSFVARVVVSWLGV